MTAQRNVAYPEATPHQAEELARHEPHRSGRSIDTPRRRPRVRARRHGEDPRARRRGEPRADPGVPGRGDPQAGVGGTRDVHGAEGQLRRRRRADVPGAQPDRGQDRGRHSRRRAASEAVLPAGAGREGGQDQGAPHRSLIGWRPALATVQDPPGLPPFAVEEEAPSRGQLAKEIPLLIGLAILIAFLVKTFVAQAFYIPSGSMIPQLNIGDRVIVSKMSYDLHDPNRGDIIVFDAPPGAPGVQQKPKASVVGGVIRDVFESIGVLQPSTEEYIKRVIGLPGETVEGKDGHVFINGRELVEPYLPAGTSTSNFGPITVPKGGLWVMGDNRSNSSDSRVFGTIRRRTVVGRAILRVWPFGRAAFL